MANFIADNGKLIWSGPGEVVQIECWGPDSLRVRATPSAYVSDPLGEAGALLDQDPIAPTIELADGQARISNGALCAIISAAGVVRFCRTAGGQELLAEKPRHFVWPPARHYAPLAGDTYRIEATFQAYADERIYGLGQQQHGKLNQKGCVIDLIQRNTEVSIPFLVSSRGYGFLWHNPAVGRVELGHNATRWVAEATPQLDYWITSGETPADILDHYTQATGRSPLLPEWAAGFWQCKLRYRNQEELLSVAREYHQRGLPLAVIVIDGGHWTLMGDWRLDPRFWPDPAALVSELESLGVKVQVSVWPTVNALSRNFEMMRQRGWLVRTRYGSAAVTPLFDIYPPGPLNFYLYDATHPAAREYLWEQIRAGYTQYGIKLFWLDADEPEINPIHPENLRYHLGDGQAIHNLYPLLHARGFYEGLRREGETDIVTLNRSAWAGSQRYGAAVWSGDIDSTFESLQAQVRAGLNIALSGIPWWTTDIGGFKGGDVTSPYFQELIVRWFQYGTFCPIFRLHGLRQSPELQTNFTDLSELVHTAGQDNAGAFGLEGFTGGPNEVWSFGEQAYTIIRELLFLRERLRPYIMAQMALAQQRGTPPQRPLFFDFPQDKAAYEVEDQFMFGPDLLVAPVLHEGAVERPVYLPRGTAWTNVWTGQTHSGGVWVTVAAPLDRIPLFTRDNAQLPIVG